MADYNQNIKVTADIKQAESQLNKLTKALQNLQSDAFIDVGKAAASGGVKLAQKNLQEYGKTLGSLDRQLGGFGKRLGDVAKAFDFAGKTTVGIVGLNALGTALSSLNGFATTGAAGIKTIGGLIAAIPKIVGGSITVLQGFGGALAAVTAPAAKVAAGIAALGPQGLAAAGGIAAATAAFMAFSPAVKKVVTGLDNLVLGGKIQSAFDGIKGKVEGTKQSFLGLNTTIETTVQAMNELAEGMSLRQLNSQVSSLTKEMQSFHSSTEQAWEAAQGLVRAQKAQVLEQKALNDLVRQAKGLQPQDVRDYEFYKRKNDLQSGRFKQNAAKEAAADAKRLADELWEANKAWYAFEAKGKAAFAEKAANDAKRLADELWDANKAWYAFEAAGKAAYTDQIKKSEQARSEAARQRLSEPKKAQPFDGITRRLISGVAYPEGAGPGEGPSAQRNVEQSVQLLVRKSQLERQAITDASKTLQIQYNWNQALKQGVAIAADMRRLQAEDLKAQTQKVAKLREQMAIKQREQQFEEKLARIRQRNDDRKGVNKKIEGAAIGGAFPLLFGGGAGSVLGGALGGLNTDNPIFSVFTSAIGQMVDQWVAATGELAKGLKNPTDAMAALEAAGFRVDASTKNQVNRLMEVGRAYEAQSVILAEVESKLGAGSVQALNALASEQIKLKEQWDTLAGSIQGELIPALVGVVAYFGDLVVGLNALNSFKLPGWLTALLTATNPLFGKELALAQMRGNEVVSNAAKRTALDPQLKQEAADKLLAEAERAEALRRQGIQLERQKQDLDLQIADQVYGFRQRGTELERATIDLRRSVEEEVYKKRSDIVRLEADNARQQAQLAVERLDMQLEGGRTSGNKPGQDLANSLLDGVRQYVKTRAEGEAELQAKEKLHIVEMEDLRRASEKFRFEVSRKVADLDRQAIELTRDLERAKITTARAIYDLALARINHERAWEKERLANMTDPAARLARTSALTGQINGAAGGATTAPAATPGIPASVGQANAALGAISTIGNADLSGLLESLGELDEKLLNAKTTAVELAAAFTQMGEEKSVQVLGQAVQSIVDQLNAPLDQLLKSQKDAIAFQREYAGLLQQGISPALAEQVARIREQVRLQLEQLNTVIAQAEATKLQLMAQGKWTSELEKQLGVLYSQKAIIESKGQAAVEAAFEAARYQEQVARNTQAAAGAAGQFADEMQRAAGAASSVASSVQQAASSGGGGGGGGLGAFGIHAMGMAGQNPEFARKYNAAMMEIGNKHITPAESTRQWAETQKYFYGLAQAYNNNYHRKARQEAKEAWDSVMHWKSTPDLDRYGSMGTAMDQFGSSGSRMGSAQVNVTTGPVINLSGTEYVTKSDMTRATQQVADDMLSQLRSNPAVRRDVGLTR